MGELDCESLFFLRLLREEEEEKEKEEDDDDLFLFLPLDVPVLFSKTSVKSFVCASMAERISA